jgi:hypothetical protein
VPFAVTPDGHGFRLDTGVVMLGPSVLVAMTPRVISFAPDGSASGGSLRVQVGRKQRTIQIDWLTGRVIVAGS